jgi:hypothetical protein
MIKQINRTTSNAGDFKARLANKQEITFFRLSLFLHLRLSLFLDQFATHEPSAIIP